MYLSIYQYAKSHELIPLKNRAYRTPVAYICIDEEGNYERLDVVPKANREKRLCPDIGKNRAAAGTNANIICNKKEYIFCVLNENGETTGNASKHKGWMSLTAEGSSYSETMKSIWFFCQKLENKDFYSQIEQELMSSGIKKADMLSFRINGIRAEDENLSDWSTWFDQRMDALNNENKEDVIKSISAITGEEIIPIQGKDKFPQIMTSQTGTGSPVYSCRHSSVEGLPCSFTSYGIGNSLSCPMSIEEADAIKAGLEFLLSSKNNHNDLFNIIYWYENDDVEDLIDVSINGYFDDDEDEDNSTEKDKEYTKLINAVRDGNTPVNLKDSGFYTILHFEVPAKGRFFLNGEKRGKYSDLYSNMCQWYSDSLISILRWDEEGRRYVKRQRILNKLYGVLFGLLDHKGGKGRFSEIKNEYGTDRDALLMSIHENKQIPFRFYEMAIRRAVRVFMADFSSEEGRNLRRENLWPVPLQVIKVYLIRNNMEEYKMDELNIDNASIAYNCGRMLAAIDRLQRTSAESNLNLSVGQKYFKAASKTPAKIMTMALANEQSYLKKIKGEGTKTFFIRLLGELSERIGLTIPETFNKIEQGEFMLGYFYQDRELRLYNAVYSTTTEKTIKEN